MWKYFIQMSKVSTLVSNYVYILLHNFILTKHIGGNHFNIRDLVECQAPCHIQKACDMKAEKNYIIDQWV